MKFNTFIKIYYDHRIQKAKFFKKIYIYTILPFSYFFEKLTLKKIINLDNFQLKNKNLFNKDLNYLFEHFDCDKGNKFINQYARYSKKNLTKIKGHKYHNYYEKYFKKIKKKKINILELGTFKGNSTASFFFYFKKASFYACDLYPDLFRYKSERIKNFLINTGSRLELKNFIKKNNYDIIIEDAGHYHKDQILSLFILFKKLKKNGLFVIEELDFPDTRNDMNPKNDKNTLYNILNLILKNKDFNSEFILKSEKDFFLKNVKKIKIFKGRFNKIAFIEKK